MPLPGIGGSAGSLRGQRESAQTHPKRKPALPLLPAFAIVLLVLSGVPAQAESLGPRKTPHSIAYLHLIALEGLSSPSAPLQSGEYLAVLELDLEDGWHTYWKNPGDSGTRLISSWKTPSGWSGPELLWPTPMRISSGPLMTYGMEGNVLLPFLFSRAGQPGSFSVELEWLECADICVPARLDFHGELRAGRTRLQKKAPAASRGLRSFIASIESYLPTPLASPVEATSDGEWLRINFAGSEDRGMVFRAETREPGRDAYVFVENTELIAHADKQIVSDSRVLLPLQPGSQVPDQIQGVVRTGKGHYSFLANVTAVDSIDESEVETLMDSIITYSGLALLGGLILNLMPCVLPVLSLKIFHLMSLSGESRKRLFLYTGTYSLGVIVSFLLLSGLLIALRSAGEQLGWGFHLQSSGFLVFMILFLSLFAFNLLGVFEIGLSLTSIAAPEIKQSHGARALGSAFLSGVLATVVASPCTAPFMGSAIGFALSQSAYVTLTVFFFLGLGLALPFLLAGIFPAILKIFPKPGAWMVRFKQLLAFPLLATVAWLLWVLGKQTSIDSMTLALFATLFMGLAAYLYGNFMQPFAHKATSYVAALFAFVLILSSLGAGYLDFDSKGANSSRNRIPPMDTTAELPEYRPGEWIPFSPALVQKFREANVPVFIDFTADWCLSCKVNKRTVLNTDEIKLLFQDTGTATFMADWTNEDPVISRELEKLGRNGVPVYALYIPGEDEPRLLPEILTKGIMFEAFAPLESRNAAESEAETSAENTTE